MDQQELLEAFRDEATAHLRSLDEELSTDTPRNDPEVLKRMFIAIHTVKGGAAMLGMDSALQIATVMEDVLGQQRERVRFPSPGAASLMLDGTRLLHELVLDRAGPRQLELVPSVVVQLHGLLADPGARPENPRPSSMSIPRVGERIWRGLVVEEPSTYRSVVTTLLQEAGYEVESIGDAATALQRLRDAPYDLLIASASTDGRTGPDIAASARAETLNQNLAIAVIGAAPESEPAQAAVADVWLPAGPLGQRKLRELAQSIRNRREDPMKDRPIRVLIADDSALSRHLLTQLITAQADMEIVASATSGREAVRMATDLQPDVCLMDIHMPDLDGIQAAWLLASRVPHGAVIMVTIEQRPDFIQKALAAGARGYVVKPLGDGQQLLDNVREVHKTSLGQQLRLGSPDRVAEPTPEQMGKKIAVFGSKGGVGKTTIAVALALALQAESKRGAVLMDADFMFGDSAIHLDLPVKHSPIDLLPYTRALDSFIVRQVLEEHPTGLHVLPPPQRPEQSEILNGENVRPIIQALAKMFEFVVVDTQPSYDERMLAALDLADVHLIVLSAQIGAVRNTRHFLDVAKVLGFPEDRMCFVLNRANSLAGMAMTDIAGILGDHPIIPVPSAGAALSEAINHGSPLYVRDPNSPFSVAVKQIADKVKELAAAREVGSVA